MQDEGEGEWKRARHLLLDCDRCAASMAAWRCSADICAILQVESQPAGGARATS
jgi:hypothetical protein